MRPAWAAVRTPSGQDHRVSFALSPSSSPNANDALMLGAEGYIGGAAAGGGAGADGGVSGGGLFNGARSGEVPERLPSFILSAGYNPPPPPITETAVSPGGGGGDGLSASSSGEIAFNDRLLRAARRGTPGGGAGEAVSVYGRGSDAGGSTAAGGGLYGTPASHSSPTYSVGTRMEGDGGGVADTKAQSMFSIPRRSILDKDQPQAGEVGGVGGGSAAFSGERRPPPTPSQGGLFYGGGGGGAGAFSTPSNAFGGDSVSPRTPMSGTARLRVGSVFGGDSPTDTQGGLQLTPSRTPASSRGGSSTPGFYIGRQPFAEDNRALMTPVAASGGGGGAAGDAASAAEANAARCWVTVFGFQASMQNLVLREMRNHGDVLRYVPGKGNWLHLQYRTELQAQVALSKRVRVVGGATMVGVMELMEGAMAEEVALAWNSPSHAAAAAFGGASSPSLAAGGTPQRNAASPISGGTPSAPRAYVGAEPALGLGSLSQRGTPQPQRGLINQVSEFVFGW